MPPAMPPVVTRGVAAAATILPTAAASSSPLRALSASQRDHLLNLSLSFSRLFGFLRTGSRRQRQRCFWQSLRRGFANLRTARKNTNLKRFWSAEVCAS